MTLTESFTVLNADAGLCDAAARAQAAFPAEHARIAGGLALCQANGVTLFAGVAFVKSFPYAERHYMLDGHCPCGEVPTVLEGRCRHFWAQVLYKQALDACLRANGTAQYPAIYTASCEDDLSHGIAEYCADVQGWRFIPADGAEPQAVAFETLCIHDLLTASAQ